MKYETVEIMPEVTLIRDKNTNIYVVESKTSALVIDTGYGLLNLKSKVEEITDKPVTAVVFTHGHNDHAFGGHYFDKVYMHKDEMPVFERHCSVRKPQIRENLAGEYNLSPDELKMTLSDLISGAAGEPYNNPVASGMIYTRNGCEVVYAPDKIRKVK